MNKEKTLFVRWVEGHNFGDAMTPIVVEYLSGISPVHVQHPGKLFFLKPKPRVPVYAVIGSIISQVTTIKNTIIWGAGFKTPQDRLWYVPKEICAVRGPLSRAKLLEFGVKCPPIYGDPALLYPRFYSPPKNKKHKLGIIPHFIDFNTDGLVKFRNDPDIKIINVKENVEKVINDINSCEKIASSSLHGIIIADAYGIPSSWVKFSNKVQGSGFKFMDYFLSTGRPYQEPIYVTETTSLKTLTEGFTPYEIKIDLERLLEACPFKKG